MSEAKSGEEMNWAVWALWIGGVLVALGAARLITGIWSPEAAETAGATNTPISIALVVVGLVLIGAWAWLRGR